MSGCYPWRKELGAPVTSTDLGTKHHPFITPGTLTIFDLCENHESHQQNLVFVPQVFSLPRGRLTQHGLMPQVQQCITLVYSRCTLYLGIGWYWYVYLVNFMDEPPSALPLAESQFAGSSLHGLALTGHEDSSTTALFMEGTAAEPDLLLIQILRSLQCKPEHILCYSLYLALQVLALQITCSQQNYSMHPTPRHQGPWGFFTSHRSLQMLFDVSCFSLRNVAQHCCGHEILHLGRK